MHCTACIPAAHHSQLGPAWTACSSIYAKLLLRLLVVFAQSPSYTVSSKSGSLLYLDFHARFSFSQSVSLCQTSAQVQRLDRRLSLPNYSGKTMSIPRSSSGRHFNTTATAGTVSFLPAMTAEEEKRRLQLYESEKDDELSSVSMSSASSSPIASTSRSVNPNNNNQQQQLQQSSLPENEEKPPSRAMVTFSVLFYLVAALVMVITTVLNHYMPREAEKSRLGWLQVMVNKWVLNSVRVPLFFLFVQLAIAVVLLHVSQMLGEFRTHPQPLKIPNSAMSFQQATSPSRMSTSRRVKAFYHSSASMLRALYSIPTAYNTSTPLSTKSHAA